MKSSTCATFTALNCIALILLASSATRAATPPSPFGLNGVGYFHYRDEPNGRERAQTKLSWLRDAGAKWDRFDFWWGEIEPKKGTWKWDQADWLIDLYSRSGVGMLPIICYKANWMTDPPHTEQDFNDFAEYTFQVVKRYKGRVKYWEVWNEPNIPTFWKPPSAADYARLLKSAYAAAKKADPNCVIVGASANETDINWLLDIARHGGGEAMDVVSFHPYSMSDGPEEMDLARQIRNMRAAVDKVCRPHTPIWITEMGWTADAKSGDEVAKQCRYLVQSHVIALAGGVEKIFWFNLQDWREAGKLEGWGMVTPEGKAKSSAAAYRKLVNQLEGAAFKGYIPMERGIAYVFDRKGRDLTVAWAHRGQRQQFEGANVELREDPAYVFPRTGQRFTGVVDRLAERDNLLINASFEETGGENDPIYGWNRGVFYGGGDKGTFAVSTDACADGKRAATLSNAEDAMWQSFSVPAMPGETYTLTARIRASDATGENGVQILSLSGPGWGWKGGPASPTITGTTAGWKQVTITATVPDDADVVRVNLFSKNNSGTVAFDDLRLVRSEPSK